MMALQAGIGEVALGFVSVPAAFISILMTRSGWKVHCPAPRQSRPYSSFGSFSSLSWVYRGRRAD